MNTPKLNNKNNLLPSFVIGFGVSCVHFLITPLFERSFILVLMLAPSFIPIVIISALSPLATHSFHELFSFDSGSIARYAYKYSSILEIFFRLFSSLFYGALAGMLAKVLDFKNKTILWAFVFVLLLFFYFGCFLLSLAGQSSA